MSSLEKYLNILLSFVPHPKGSRLMGDYLSLIHVPAQGTERVYSLVFDSEQPLLTSAQFKETVWQVVEGSGGAGPTENPTLDALQATVDADHPAFEHLSLEALQACRSRSDGMAGMDYYLMLWQKEGQANVVECWEPYQRNDEAWLAVIGVLQALTSQFEYAAAKG